MTTIFVSHTQEDAACAEHIRHDLEARGYGAWREPGYPGPTDSSYPRVIENAILGSAAVVLVWSSSAAQSEWVERHTLFAQRLKKLIVPVVLDGTSLPSTLVSVTPITSQAPCTDVVAQLVSFLPPSNSTDPLIVLAEQAAYEFIRVRKEAIDAAAELLRRGEQREAVLALLAYLARNDSMMGVREKAQEALDAEAKKSAPPSSQRPDQARHIFGVTCRNGHVTYFDKRRVCTSDNRKIVRGSKELDELYLKCGQCDDEMIVHVDCGSYNRTR